MSTPVSNGALLSAERSTTPLSAIFWTRVHRYRSLLRKRWWVLLLALSLGLCVQAWRVATQPPNYVSNGQVILGGEVKATGSDKVYREYNTEFQKTIVALITSQEVRKRAWEQMEAKEGGAFTPLPVELDVQFSGTVFTLQAVGPDANFTRKFLDETMNALLELRRGMRDDATGKAAFGIKDQLLRLEDELKKDDEAILDFQRNNKIVLQRNENEEAKQLQSLNGKLQDLKAKADQLEFMDPNQPSTVRLTDLGLGGPAGNGGAPGNGGTSTDNSDSDIRAARQMLARVRSEYEDLGRDLRPAHPKMKALAAELAKQQKSVDELLRQNKGLVKDQLALARSLIQRTQVEIDAAKTNALAVDEQRAVLDKLRTKRDRDDAHYNGLQKSLTDLKLNTNVEQDTITVLQRASAPVSVKSGWFKNLALGVIAGLAAGVGILLLLDRIDDRMGSFSDFQNHFSESVIGQIPRDDEAQSSKDGVQSNTELLVADDPRHQLVESYRNIRSSLLYMPLAGERPKTLLVTSAIPNEGKSTIATNLALVMAFAGMKTLLIDGDLRRGAIHDSFGLSREPGLSDVLGRTLPWREAVRATDVANLSFLPRGRNVPQPSEYLLNPHTDTLIKELYSQYDYVIIDSSPVLAADDTASLAPKMDATLFVVRLGFTSAKMSRKALEILDKRQANIPGVILNFIDTTSPEFVYYQYPEYYHAPVAEEPSAPSPGGVHRRNGTAPKKTSRV